MAPIRIKDFEDGIDKIVFEKIGVKAYNSSGAAGTAFAYDLPDGSVRIDVVTSSNTHFSIFVDDPYNTLSFSNFSSSDFLFA